MDNKTMINSQLSEHIPKMNLYKIFITFFSIYKNLRQYPRITKYTPIQIIELIMKLKINKRYE